MILSNKKNRLQFERDEYADIGNSHMNSNGDLW